MPQLLFCGGPAHPLGELWFCRELIKKLTAEDVGWEAKRLTPMCGLGNNSFSNHQFSEMVSVADTWPRSKWDLDLRVTWLVRKINSSWLQYLQVAIGEKHSDELGVRILKIDWKRYNFWFSRIEKGQRQEGYFS